jgi:hypothetical protein
MFRVLKISDLCKWTNALIIALTEWPTIYRRGRQTLSGSYFSGSLAFETDAPAPTSSNAPHCLVPTKTMPEEHHAFT